MAYVLDAGIDQATAELIVQLQREDAALYFESSKGKSRDPTSEEAAFQLHNEELDSISQLLADRRMAMSFAAAVQADGQILANSRIEEDTATKDRDIARHWTENGSPVTLDNSQPESTALDDETLAKLQILYMSGLGGYHGKEGVETFSTEIQQPESSAWAAQRNRQSAQQLHRCVACREETEFVKVLRVPCRHEYCLSCLEDLFKASMTDESLFPPRCCQQPIVVSTARIFLKADLVREYEKKKVEFETPNRTYCHSPSCSTFINPRHIDGEVATCPECGHTTCTNCKGRAHTGDCPNDTALQQLLDTARENEWQRCYSCSRVVELNHGCNHITCLCGAQFCYNCGARWKTCQCEQWDEHRLLARAFQIIDRDENPPPAVAPPPPDINEPQPEGQPIPEVEEVQLAVPQDQREEVNDEPHATVEGSAPIIRTQGTPTRQDLLERTMRELRENHECSHGRWRYIPGPHRCEECFHHLNKYIFECRQCRLQACNRCRRNRL